MRKRGRIEETTAEKRGRRKEITAGRSD